MHIGDNQTVVCEFPCPVCMKGIAKGTVKKSQADKDGFIDIHCDCPCEKSFDGTVVIHPAGLDVDVTIDDPRVKDSELKVYGV
ncbi:hypothetical protein FACS189483_03000 [Spirochaetia bacterium]|nr:hypothetical protein FACS189483_03000 [Spirochaetia bacterium]